MIESLTLEEFQRSNRITTEQWTDSDCSWEELRAIGIHHLSNAQTLRDVSTFYATQMQRFNGVHSVRWRVKDAEHLMTKIVRKRAEKSEKYMALTIDNYAQIVTDLIGLRALHLFKDDCFDIDKTMRENFTTIETPIAYLRAGDFETLQPRFADAGLDVRVHPAGYRSIHYVISTAALKTTTFLEIQVRTLFEEGWSEIDHTIRYPNISDDAQITYLLTILNRMAGSADEMGMFVRSLAGYMNESRRILADAQDEKEKILEKMTGLLSQLGNLQSQDQASKAKIGELSEQLKKLSVPATAQYKWPSINTSFLETASIIASSKKFKEMIEVMAAARAHQTDLSNIAKRALLPGSEIQSYLKNQQDLASQIRNSVTLTSERLREDMEMMKTQAKLNIPENIQASINISPPDK